MSQQYPNGAIYGINFTKTDWKNIFTLPVRTTTETKLHWLQRQIIHRIIPCNTFLFHIKVTNSPVCSFCKDDLETIKTYLLTDILLKNYGVTQKNGFQINLIDILASTENQSLWKVWRPK